MATRTEETNRQQSSKTQVFTLLASLATFVISGATAVGIYGKLVDVIGKAVIAFFGMPEVQTVIGSVLLLVGLYALYMFQCWLYKKSHNEPGTLGNGARVVYGLLIGISALAKGAVLYNNHTDIWGALFAGTTMVVLHVLMYISLTGAAKCVTLNSDPTVMEGKNPPIEALGLFAQEHPKISAAAGYVFVAVVFFWLLQVTGVSIIQTVGAIVS